MSSDKDILYLLNDDCIVVGYGKKGKLHVFPYKGKKETEFQCHGQIGISLET